MTEAEVLPLEACFGRAPASFQLTAAVDVPPFDNSSMDGYALRAADTPGRLRLVGEVAAGAGMLPEVGPGAAARIMTGAPMPPGADAVAPIEVVTEAEADVEVPATELGAYVRRAGHDTRAGDAVTLPSRAALGRHAGPAGIAWRGRAGRASSPAGRDPVDRRRAAAAGRAAGAGPDPRRQRDRAGGGHHRGRRRTLALERARTIRRRSSSGSCVAWLKPTCWWRPAACRSGVTTTCAT